MKKKNTGAIKANNISESKNNTTRFFVKSGSPKNIKETARLILNLVINFFG